MSVSNNLHFTHFTLCVFIILNYPLVLE